MPQFVYKGILISGEETEGRRAAHNEEELRGILARDGIIPVKIGKKSLPIGVSSATGRANKRQLLGFTRQISVMLRNGMRLDSIFRVLLRQRNSQCWQQTLEKMSNHICEGHSLSDSIAAESAVFDQFYIGLVRAGETSGELAEVFSRLTRSLENSDRLNRKIRGSLAYPAVILSVAALVLFILLVYIVPVFKEMFLNFRTELPAITKLVVGISDLLTKNPIIWSLAFMMALGASLIVSRLSAVKYFLSRTILGVPRLRNLVIKSETATFSRTMSTLLAGGVSLGEAIPLASSAVKNQRLRDKFASATFAIAHGQNLNSAWRESDLIPPMVSEMVSVGEETGRLAQMFDSIADYYSEEVESILPALTAVIEPLLIVIVGVFVAAILISMYLPLFELIGQLG